MRILIAGAFASAAIGSLPCAAHAQDASRARTQALRAPSRIRSSVGARHAARAAAAEPRRAHVQGDDEVGARAAVHQSGREPRLRVQSRRSRPRVCRSRAPRSRTARWPTGVTRSCSARTSTRRWSRRTNRRRSSWLRRRRSLKPKATRARAGVHRRARRSATPASRKIGSRPTARSPTRCASWSPPYPTDLDAKTILRGIADGPAALELLDARRPAVRRDARRSGDRCEQVLASNPKHPGALHYWIHLWEPTDTPERAEAEADRLLPLMPGAGHIVHMPAHIYMRVGRHADVVKSNQLAAKADEDYIAQCRAQGLYPLGYYPHNLHFIWMGATAHRVRASSRSTPRTSGRRDPATRRWARCRSSRDSWSCRTGRWCASAVGRDPRGQGAAARHAVHPRRLALRARDGPDRNGPPSPRRKSS